eukprot:760786-Hanusia_phi.AAC.8
MKGELRPRVSDQAVEELDVGEGGSVEGPEDAVVVEQPGVSHPRDADLAERVRLVPQPLARVGDQVQQP